MLILFAYFICLFYYLFVPLLARNRLYMLIFTNTRNSSTIPLLS